MAVSSKIRIPEPLLEITEAVPPDLAEIIKKRTPSIELDDSPDLFSKADPAMGKLGNFINSLSAAYFAGSFWIVKGNILKRFSLQTGNQLKEIEFPAVGKAFLAGGEKPGFKKVAWVPFAPLTASKMLFFLRGYSQDGAYKDLPVVYDLDKPRDPFMIPAPEEGEETIDGGDLKTVRIGQKGERVFIIVGLDDNLNEDFSPNKRNYAIDLEAKTYLLDRVGSLSKQIDIGFLKAYSNMLGTRSFLAWGKTQPGVLKSWTSSEKKPKVLPAVTWSYGEKEPGRNLESLIFGAAEENQAILIDLLTIPGSVLFKFYRD